MPIIAGGVLFATGTATVSVTESMPGRKPPDIIFNPSTTTVTLVGEVRTDLSPK